MTLGLENGFNILEHSPHDIHSQPGQPSEGPKASTPKRWVPSRYNVRATARDGRLILWNTHRGSIAVFQADQAPAILTLLRQNGTEGPEQGVIEYLSQRGFLVPEGTNEYRTVRASVSQYNYRSDRLQLVLLSSEDCNFRCRYCYEKFSRGTMSAEVRKGIKNLVRNEIGRLRELDISWFGGEPLYGFRAIEDLAPFFHKITEENTVAFRSHITTNAYLLRPEVAAKLLRWRVNSFQITIDGPPESHNRNRPTRNGKGSFHRIFNNLKSLRDRPERFHVGLRINFDRTTAQDLGSLLEILAKEIGNDPRFDITFFPIGRWGGKNDDQLEIYQRDELREVFANLRKQARDLGLRVEGLKGQHRLGSRVCYAGRPYNFVIGASGQVMKCTILLDTEDYNMLGHIRPDGELKIDEHKLALWTSLVFEEDDKCKKCVFLPTCQGRSCPLARLRDSMAPCISTRFNPKEELLGILDTGTANARNLQVSA